MHDFTAQQQSLYTHTHTLTGLARPMGTGRGVAQRCSTTPHQPCWASEKLLYQGSTQSQDLIFLLPPLPGGLTATLYDPHFNLIMASSNQQRVFHFMFANLECRQLRKGSDTSLVGFLSEEKQPRWGPNKSCSVTATVIDDD